MSSLLIFNIEENIDKEELYLIFESIPKKGKNINDIDVSDIELSRDYKSAIINFKDERSSKEIFDSEIEIKIDNYNFAFVPLKKMFIINPFNNESKNELFNSPLASDQIDFQQSNLPWDSNVKIYKSMDCSHIGLQNKNIGSLLIHNIDDETDVSDLELMFESLHRYDENISKIEVSSIELSRHFKSGIITFKDEKTANEILTSQHQITKGNQFFNLMSKNQMFIRPVNIPNVCIKKSVDIIVKSANFYPTESNFSNRSSNDPSNNIPWHNNNYLLTNSMDDTNNFSYKKDNDNDYELYNLSSFSNHNNISNINLPVRQVTMHQKPSYSQIVQSKSCLNYRHLYECNHKQLDMNFSAEDYNSETNVTDMDHDQWELLNKNKVNTSKKNYINMSDIEKSSYSYSSIIKLDNTILKIEQKKGLINRMKLSGRINPGFHLSFENDLPVLRCNNNDDLHKYSKKLEEIFNSHYSETELNVSKVIGIQLKTEYGIKWINSVLNDNNIIGIFDHKKLSVIGFDSEETKRGELAIQTALVISPIKESKMYPNVDIFTFRGIRFIKGLPHDVIKALN